MTTPRRLADLSPSLLSRLRSAASSLLSRQYSTDKGGDGTARRNGRGSSSAPRPLRPGFVDPSKWRHFDSRAFGINLDAIPKDALFVLKKLRREGCLIFGVIIKKNIFRQCMIVGRRFPICLLKMNDSVIEVSSFRTVGKRANKSKERDYLEELNGYDDGDILRCKNSMRRDFTINGLFFNPMNYKIYDYVNGVRDMRKNKARLTMEMNYILSYGAAEPSVRLLRRYGLLDILLPFQAAYLSDQMKGRSSDKDLMLMKLLANLDRLFSADRPCHCSLWMALLVFHTALVISPQDTLVIRAFAALLYFGSWESAIEFLKEEEAGPQVPFVPETLGPSQTKLDDLMEQTSHLASLVNSSVLALTCSDALEQSLARFSEPPQFSGVVLASNKDRSRLMKIFGTFDSDLTSHDERRWLHKIDYWSLKDGSPAEVRFALGKVILDTMSDKSPCESVEDALVF
ncbi:CCA-adding enzyme [Panicum miliaceum]|uniref:CCA-adding enzyme n=1 Tax=Panicum miliaceum TaxID=4540 RepID=A0A3L6TVK9_PANMI|nr:CCA-adding enzyme [Panicum miliaceum]